MVLKRVVDLALAIGGIVFLLPVFAFAAVIVKMFSRGPVFFTQERIGMNARPFKIYKFRTMAPGASAIASGSVTARNDPRLFPGANFLRKFKIDELPQLLNVLNGTMSLVGPRPTVREDYERMDEQQRQRFSVKPGLTGLAQIRGNTSLSWPRRIRLDLYYVRHYSVWLDLVILFRTVALVVTGRAETHPATTDEWVTA